MEETEESSEAVSFVVLSFFHRDPELDPIWAQVRKFTFFVTNHKVEAQSFL